MTFCLYEWPVVPCESKWRYKRRQMLDLAILLTKTFPPYLWPSVTVGSPQKIWWLPKNKLQNILCPNIFLLFGWYALQWTEQPPIDLLAPYVILIIVSLKSPTSWGAASTNPSINGDYKNFPSVTSLLLPHYYQHFSVVSARPVSLTLSDLLLFMSYTAHNDYPTS